MTFTGIKITRPGIDVKKAADYQYLFNSDWPSLQIVFDYTYDGSQGFPYTKAHNLGFVPMAKTQNGSDGAITFDATNVYWVSTSGNVKLFNIDITKNKSFPLVAIPKNNTIGPYDAFYGIKVAKYGKKISSNDLRDFILHTRAQSLALLQVSTGVGSVTYKNPQDYTPLSLGFYENADASGPTGKWTEIQPVPILFSRSLQLFKFIDPRNGYYDYYGADLINGAPGLPTQPRCTIVTLRDPLLSLNRTRVIY